MNLTSVPAGIKTGSTQYLQIFRWKDGTGGFELNSIPVRMQFLSKFTGTVISTSTVDRISKSIIETLIQNAGLQGTGLTPSNFFEQYTVVLSGMDFQWYAISIAYYNTATGSGAAGNADAMLPPIVADPNVYMSYVPSTRLHILHPNYPWRTSGASEQEFQNLSEEICTEFFGSIRYTASVKNESLWDKVKGLFKSVTRLLYNFFGL